MFTRAEFKQIDRKSFEIVQKTAFYIILKSKSTGHTWAIYSSQLDNKRRSLVIWHKHNDDDQFHIQRKFHPKNLSEAQKLLKEHDEWHLNGRK